MGFLAFGIFCLIVIGIAVLLVKLFAYFIPGHPAIIDQIIWGIGVLIIALKLLDVTGLMSHDPQIPHF